MNFKTSFLAKASIAKASSDIKTQSDDLISGNQYAVSGQVITSDIGIIESIILTTGRPGNNNDDVVLNEDLIPVLESFLLKPFDINHNPQNIIGTITEVKLLDAQHNLVEVPMDDEMKKHPDKMMEHIRSLPENLDVYNRAILWRAQLPDTYAMLMDLADKNELFVSMEMWHGDYDYLVDSTVVKRNAETVRIFDPVLRRRGGTGSFMGKKVKRVLRQLIGAGIGAVLTPANTRSVVLSISSDLNEVAADINKEWPNMNITAEALSSYMNSMTNVGLNKVIAANQLSILGESRTDKQVADTISVDADEGRSLDRGGNHPNGNSSSGLVQSDSKEIEMNEELEKAQARIAELEKQLEGLTGAEAKLADALSKYESLAAEATKLREDVANKDTMIAQKDEALKEFGGVKVALETITQRAEAAEAKLNELLLEQRTAARRIALSNLGLPEARIEKEIKKVIHLSDEDFEAHVNDLKELIDSFKTKTDAATVESGKDTIVDPKILDEGNVNKNNIAVANLLNNAGTDGAEDDKPVLRAVGKIFGVIGE